jgi:GT2 family glycosyltransferase
MTVADPADRGGAGAPRLSVVVVSWGSGADAVALAEAMPRDPRFELVVVDNGGGGELAGLAPAPGRAILAGGGNLGFAGGSNRGARAARGELLLFLNPDARPEPGSLAALVDGFAHRPDAAGLVPRLVGFDGRPQCAWQLRPLPGPAALLAHAFFWNPAPGARREPPAGTPVAQPAAAALALRRAVFEAVGGFDEGYWPAWFEDVDLARRLAGRGARLLYHPDAVFRHRIGSSVSALGYGAFLEAYDRNLARYLDRHHGRGWARAFTALVPVAALARLALLPLRRPARAASRREAARALLRVARAALGGFPPPPHAAPPQPAEPRR